MVSTDMINKFVLHCSTTYTLIEDIMKTATIRANKIDSTDSFSWLTKLKEKFAQYQIRTQTIKELQSLSDWELRDIGLGRNDIRSVAEGLAKGDLR